MFIPTFLTCLNLFCGCVAVVQVFRGHLTVASYLVFTAAFLDLLDGLAARLFDAHSEFGKQMDSLADAVSFGVVPGVIMFSLLQRSHLENVISNYDIRRAVQYVPFIISVFSALRLAKFNIDTRQTTSFIGLPTPANALLLVSLPFVIEDNNASINAILLSPYFILGSSILLSYLLISELPMFSLKMKSFAFADNKIQYVFLALSLVLVIFFLFKALPLIIILYILLSILNHLFNKETK